MEKALAEGSQTFEHDISRLIREGQVSQEEGLLASDSPTNLLWRLQNDAAPTSRVAAPKPEPDSPSFTEITLDVMPEAPPSPLRQPYGSSMPDPMHRSR
jgi:twitching motility protein PilU